MKSIPRLVSRLLFPVSLVFCALLLLHGCGPEKFADLTKGTKTSGYGDRADTVQANVEPPSKPGKYGGTFVSDMLSDPKTFNVWVSADQPSAAAVGGLFDALLTQNSYTLKWQDDLAFLPKISTHGLTWTFILKPGLEWSDGVPITADDVIFTLNVIYDTNIQSNMRESMLLDVPDGKGGTEREPIKYKKLDDRTVEFKFPIRYAPARNMLAFPIAPAHKLKAAYEKPTTDGSNAFNHTWGVDSDPNELVSSGAWILTSYVPGQRLVYSRNPHYWKKDRWGNPLPYLDNMVTIIVEDTNTETLKFQAGETDELDVQAPDYPKVKQNETNGDYKVMNLGPTWGNSYICFNQNPESSAAFKNPAKINLFQDQRFRQAVSFAINRDRLALSIFQGLASPMYAPESSANKLFFNPNTPKYEFNIPKAKALLAKIGLKDTDGDGIVELNGQDLTFNILTNVENKLRVAQATIITDDLHKAGIGATFTAINFDKLITLLDQKPDPHDKPGTRYYDWECVLMGFTGGPEPNDGRSIWQSSGNLHQWRPYETKPATPWEAEIDDIFRKGAQEMDQSKRKALYDKWQDIAGEELPLIYTVVPDGLVALRNKFGNVKPCSLGGATWNMDEMYSLDATRDRP